MFIRLASQDVERKIAISPRAYKLVRDQNIDLTILPHRGSGPHGRILARDVLLVQQAFASQPQAPHSHQLEKAIFSKSARHDIFVEPAQSNAQTSNQPASTSSQLAVLMEALDAISKAYADNAGFARTPDWFVLKLQEKIGELTQAYLKTTARSGKSVLEDGALLAAHETLESAIGAVFGQLLLLAQALDIDPMVAIRKKWGVNSP